MAYADFTAKEILNTYGKTQLVLAAACLAGDFLSKAGYLADANSSPVLPAQWVACEDGAIGDNIWVALAVIVRKKPTAGSRADVYTRGDHGGTLGDILYLSADAGKATTSGAQIVGFVLSPDTALFAPSLYLQTTALSLSSTLEVLSTSSLVGHVTFGGKIISDDTTQPTNTISGAIQTDGGIGVAKKGYFGDDVTITAGKFLVGSPQKMTITSKDDNATLTAAEAGIILVTVDGKTMTLPAVSGNAGLRYIIKFTGTASDGIIVDGNGSETIDGATTKTIAVQYGYIDIVCTGTAWVAIGIKLT